MYNIIINKKNKIKYVYTFLSWLIINIFIKFIYFNMMYNIIINKKNKIKYVYTFLSWVIINIYLSNLFNMMYNMTIFSEKKMQQFPPVPAGIYIVK